MKAALQTQTKAPTKPSITPTQAGLLQRKCACSGSAGLTGDCEACSKDRLKLQRSTRNPELETLNSAGVPPIVHEVLRSPGQPLDAETRAFMEPRFGHDFSRVRVHTNSLAQESARAVNALAFTISDHIVFGTGGYAPCTPAGRRLLAHELTHTVQQRAGLLQESSVSEVTAPGSASEQEANDAAEAINGRNPATSVSEHPVRLARQHSGVMSAVPTYATSTPGSRLKPTGSAQSISSVPTYATATLKPAPRQTCPGREGGFCAAGGKWIFEYDGCSGPAWLTNLLGIDKDNPGGGAETQFALCGPSAVTDRPCDRHDECYQTCHPTLEAKAACDKRMTKDMVQTCLVHSEDDSVRLRCLKYAGVYSLILDSSLALEAFAERQKQVCGCKDKSQPKQFQRTKSQTQGAGHGLDIPHETARDATYVAGPGSREIENRLKSQPKQSQSTKSQTQGAGHGLVPHETARDATYVAGPGSREIENRLKFAVGKVAPTKKPTPLELPSLFSRFVRMLRVLDKRLEGNATQSWGMIIYGEGDGRDSPATKASKDAKIWGSFDFAEFMELMNLVLLAIPETIDYRKKLENFRDELDPRKIMKDPAKAAEFVKDKIEEVVEIQKAFGDSATKKEAGIPGTKEQAGTLETRQPPAQRVKTAATLPTKSTTTPPPQKVEVGRWTTTELPFNQFFMMKYSDGSKRFLMVSAFGTEEISDPGPMHWKKVPSPQGGTMPQAGTDKSNVSQAIGQKATPSGQTATFNSKLETFIDNLKKDPTYGGKVRVTSKVRNPQNDARAVLKNQKSNSKYYKVFRANWETAILTAIKDRDLQITGDFDSAVSALAAWIVEKPERSPHVAGRAVDFGLAGGEADFKSFIKTEAEKRGFTFIDETSEGHYHVQM